MTDTVGVHISETQITAVRFDASSTQPPRVVVLGGSDGAAAAVVAQGEGGSVLVGDEAALITEGPRVTNPLQRAAAGRIGALVEVLSFVIRSAAAVEGKAPDRLAVVVEDDWRRAARERIVAAGVASGIADTVVVPHAAASAQPAAVTGPAALAAGAARVGSLSSTQFVTREDLGQPVTSKQPAAPVADVPRPESVSVFEDESLVEVARPGPEPLESEAHGEFGAARVVGPAASGTPRRTGLSQATITLALVLLVGVVGGLLILFTGNDANNVRTTPATVSDDTTPVDTGPPTTTADTTSEAIVTTTNAPPTSESPTGEAIVTTTTSESPASEEIVTTTTSEAPTGEEIVTTTTSESPTGEEIVTTTTSEPPTTSEPTVTSTTTTARQAGVGAPGPVTLVATGLQFDTGRVVRFGQSMAEVIDAVRSILGAPDSATNFRSSEGCEDNTRTVRWGQLELIFLQDPPAEVPVDPDNDSGGAELIPASTGAFVRWHARGHTNPTGLVTRDGLGVSATVGFLASTYSASFWLEPPSSEEGRGVFRISNPASGGVIHGTTSDATPDGRVLTLWSGDPCTRAPV